MAFVTQQHHRALRGQPRFLAVFRQSDHLRQFQFIGVWLFKEPHPYL